MSFIIDWSLLCNISSPAHKYTVEKSAREKWVYVEGVVVSICLASIFLVALIVFVCYYRAQKNNGPSRYEITKSSSKGIFLTDFQQKSSLKSSNRGNLILKVQTWNQFLQLKLVLESFLIGVQPKWILYTLNDLYDRIKFIPRFSN